MKIQKLLQSCGCGSRRDIRHSIANGLFSVNGKVIDDPNFEVDFSKDVIRKEGKKIKLKPDKRVYYILNKPLGVITSLEDPEGRITISDYIKNIKQRIYPVGRLDYNSEGLVLLTNDGELTNFIISPRNMVQKTYMIKIKGTLSLEDKSNLIHKGFYLEGRRVKFEKIDFIKKTKKGNSWLRIKIVEGKKHVIRKVFKYSGHPVEKLKRTEIGTIKLGKLPVGMLKEISHEEIDNLQKYYNFKRIK